MNTQEKLWENLYKFARRGYRKHLNDTYTSESDNLTRNGIKVSSHALIRYFERFEGYDIEKVTKKLTDENLAERVARYGDGKYKMGDDMTVVVMGSDIVTLYKHKPLYKDTGNRIRGLERLKV